MPIDDTIADEDDIDKKTLEPTYYVNIKSEGLRDILRTVLGGIRTINLNEDKPAVWLSSRLSFLSMWLT